MYRAVLVSCLICLCRADAKEPARTAAGQELVYWLANMTRHEFTLEEMSAATGLAETELRETLRRERLDDPKRRDAVLKVPEDRLLVLPYPGGRHPRIGFLEGAVDPQRETKVSVFAPWDASSYVVVDVPEAIFTNLGLTYLAHTHIPTIWTERKIELEKLEWERRADGSLRSRRRLPNGMEFATVVTSERDAVRFDFALINGSDRAVTDVRVQVCNMLKGMKGFEQQAEGDVVKSGSLIAARSRDAKRWVVAGWEPMQRAWSNPPVPCIHSDAKVPDCKPGAIQRVRGFVRFYEGTDVDAELRRLQTSGRAVEGQ
jgi:hypothetical protein